MSTRLFAHSISHRFRPRLLAVLIGAASPWLLPATAIAAESVSAIRYDIAAGPLSDVLAHFAAKAGVALSFDPAPLRSIHSAGLQGEYALEQGFEKLLEGSGYTAARTDSGYTVVRAPSTETMLKAVKVQAEGFAAEETGSYRAAKVGIGRSTAGVKEVPQAVSVVTRQRLEDQNLHSLDDALGQATGISMQQMSTVYTGIYSRGFEITNIQVDGGASVVRGYNVSVLPDMAQYEQIEVLRGADGLFSGTGEPGGVVNMARKRPTEQPQLQVSASAGRWNSYRTELDASSPLAFEDRLRGRVVLAYEDKDSFQDVAHYDKKLGYAIVEFEPVKGTLLTLGGSYEERGLPYVSTGLPRYSTGGDLHLPRSTYLAAAWSYYDARLSEVFAQFDQQLGKDWKLSVDFLHAAQDNDREALGWAAPINPVTGAGGGSAPARYAYTSDQYTLDVSLNGEFDALGRRHEVIVGGNWQKVEATSLGERTATLYTVNNIFAFDPHAYPRPASSDYRAFFYDPDYGVKQQALYGVLRFKLTDALTAIAGARYSDFEYEYISNSLNTSGVVTSTSVTRYEDNDVFTPYGGVVYRLSDDWNVYASVAETYKSQSSKLKGPLPGSPLDPITGTSYETGVKGSLFNDAFDAYIALYRIERNGDGVRDSNYPVTPGEQGSNCCWLDDGEAISQGVDAEISGEPLPGWWLSAGYAYNDNENKQATGRYHTVTPRHLLKLFTTWQLPGAASDWRVGGGVNLQSDTYVSATTRAIDASGNPTGPSIPYEFTQSGYAVWSAFAEYRVDANWTAALNLSNLFDKRYYSTVGQAGYYNFYGEPFNWTLTLRGKF